MRLNVDKVSGKGQDYMPDTTSKALPCYNGDAKTYNVDNIFKWRFDSSRPFNDTLISIRLGGSN